MINNIYFVRHGESEANVAKIFAGQREDSPLTQKGRDEAVIAAKKFIQQGLVIDKIVSSPLVRALETAKIIADVIGSDSLQIEVNAGLSEYDMGQLTGTDHKSITSLQLINAPEAEDVFIFKDRIIKTFSSLKGNVLVVSHAGVGRLLETVKKGISPEEFYDLPAYTNASITKIDWL